MQFLLRTVGRITPPGSKTGESTNRNLQAVPLTGHIDEITIKAIVALQEGMKRKMPGTVVDGRVSVARGVRYGAGFWSIVALNGFVRRHKPSLWPRLDKLPDCPQQLATKLRAIL